MKPKFATHCGIALITTLALTNYAFAAPASSGYPLEKKGTITQGFDVPWSANSSQRHTGLDVSAKKGSDVYSARSGTIEAQGYLGKGTVTKGGKKVTVDWGYYLVIRNDVGTVNAYLHIDPQKTWIIGSRVKAGEKIGVIWEDHLHFNQCLQVAGCQHGAFTNPSFPSSGVKVTKYYVKPTL